MDDSSSVPPPNDNLSNKDTQRKARHATMMKSLTKVRATGIKLQIHFDLLTYPFGENSTTSRSYVALLGTSKSSILGRE